MIDDRHTATSMRSRATSSILRITFFSILTSCDSLRARSGPKAPAAFLRKAWPVARVLAIRDGALRLMSSFRAGEDLRNSSGELESGWKAGGSRPDQAASGFVPVGSGPVARGRMREVEIRDQNRNRISLTDATLSEPSVGFGGGHWGWGVLDLGGGRSARLAHGISAMHGGGG